LSHKPASFIPTVQINTNSPLVTEHQVADAFRVDAAGIKHPVIEVLLKSESGTWLHCCISQRAAAKLARDLAPVVFNTLVHSANNLPSDCAVTLNESCAIRDIKTVAEHIEALAKD